MSNIDEKTQLCTTCGIVKSVSLFPKWRLKCKACKSNENSARLKERYATDVNFVAVTKQRVAKWQRVNAEKSNEYHRRRHAQKVTKGDKQYLENVTDANKRYRESDKGKATTALRNKRYEMSGQDKAWRQARYAKPESRTSQLLAGTRNRALKLNVKFELIFDDVYPAIFAGKCSKTGIPFNLDPHPDHRVHPFAPSLDRINPKKGYVRNNVQVVCWAYNAAKNQWGEDVLTTLARAIVDKVSTKP